MMFPQTKNWDAKLGFIDENIVVQYSNCKVAAEANTKSVNKKA